MNSNNANSHFECLSTDIAIVALLIIRIYEKELITNHMFFYVEQPIYRRITVLVREHSSTIIYIYNINKNAGKINHKGNILTMKIKL